MAKRRNARKLAPHLDWNHDPLLANIKNTTTPEHYQQIRQHFKTWGRCMFCRTFPATFQCVYSTPYGEPWGMQPGQGAVFCYHLCRACMALPDWEQRAEAHFALGRIGSRN